MARSCSCIILERDAWATYDGSFVGCVAPSNVSAVVEAAAAVALLMAAALAYSVPMVKRRCKYLTADDCLLGFSGISEFHRTGPLFAGLYFATPKLFTVQPKSAFDSSHFNASELRGQGHKLGEAAIVMAGYCTGIHGNAVAFSYNVPCSGLTIAPEEDRAGL